MNTVLLVTLGALGKVAPHASLRNSSSGERLGIISTAELTDVNPNRDRRPANVMSTTTTTNLRRPAHSSSRRLSLDLDGEVAALMNEVQVLSKSQLAADQYASSSQHESADCVAIGMVSKNAPCDPVLAKIINHLQFPAGHNTQCRDTTTLPSGKLWGGGFGADSKFVFPGILAGIIRAGHGVNFLTTTSHRTWLFNDPQDKATLCPGKAWYECYFAAASSCGVPSNEKCQPTKTIVLGPKGEERWPTTSLYHDLCSYMETTSAANIDGNIIWDSKAFTKTRMELPKTYVKTHRPECIATKRTNLPQRSASAQTPPASAALLKKWRDLIGAPSFSTSDPLWKTLRLHATALFFEPNAMLRGHLEDMKASIGWDYGKMVGLHVRHTDMVVENPEIGLASYCSVAARMMAQTGFAHVFIATDDRGITNKRLADCIVATAREEKITLPGEPVVLMQSWARSAGSTTVQAAHAGAAAFGLAAIIDILLISECNAVAITDGSSFSELALMRAFVNGVQIWDVVHCIKEDGPEHKSSFRDVAELVPGIVNHFPPVDKTQWRKRCARDKKHVVIADSRCSIANTQVKLKAKLEKRFDSERDQESECVVEYAEGNRFAGLEQADLCSALCTLSDCSFLVPDAHAGTLMGPNAQGWTEGGPTPCRMIRNGGREACETFSTNRCLTDPAGPFCHGAKPFAKGEYCNVYVATTLAGHAPPIHP